MFVRSCPEIFLEIYSGFSSEIPAEIRLRILPGCLQDISLRFIREFLEDFRQRFSTDVYSDLSKYFSWIFSFSNSYNDFCKDFTRNSSWKSSGVYPRILLIFFLGAHLRISSWISPGCLSEYRSFIPLGIPTRLYS